MTEWDIYVYEKMTPYIYFLLGTALFFSIAGMLQMWKVI